MTSVILLDVGHGNCAIVRSGTSAAVIDCPTGALLLDTLIDLNVDTVETAIISHADKDHIAGILSLLTSEKVRVQRVFVNPDSRRNTTIWRDFLVAVAVAEQKGTFQVVTSLSTTTPGTISIGEVSISVLCPSSAFALTGVGGKTSSGQTVTSNSLSGVLRIGISDKGGILLAADMDEIGLDNALAIGADLRADVLVFPHHGGLPGGNDPGRFASRLLGAVEPTSVVFSNGHGRHDNPRPEIVGPVRQRGCAVACTQLSTRCHPTAVDVTSHLESVRAAGRNNRVSCAGSMTFLLSPETRRVTGAREQHRSFIDDKVATPMCLTRPLSLNTT